MVEVVILTDFADVTAIRSPQLGFKQIGKLSRHVAYRGLGAALQAGQ
jgi:hypothetical protein